MHLAPLQYVTSRDRVRIAYISAGAGTPIVFASNIFGDVQHSSLETHHVGGIATGLIARGWRVVLHDVRGMGSSDRDVPDLSLEARLADLEAIVDRLGLTHFALAGTDLGAATAIAYAARHPDQVRHLVLMSPWPSGAKMFSLPHLRMAKVALTEGADDWAIFTNVLGSIVNEFGSSEFGRQIADLVRRSTTPQGLAAYYRASEAIDLTAMLSSVRAPTLVLHEPAFPFGSFALCKEVAAGIPNARMVLVNEQSIAGTDHEGHIAAIGEFLRSDAGGSLQAEYGTGHGASRDNLSPLTSREVEVLQRLADGLTNKKIAADLSIAVPTVERHLVNIYSKLGVQRRTEAVAYAIRHRLDVAQK